MKRGRPIKSDVRNRIETIIDGMGAGYGYEIFKVYREAYEPTSLRNIYYHLSKGVNEGIFVDVGSYASEGSYTWGPSVERKFYVLGHNASGKGNEKVGECLNKLGIKKRAPVKYIKWRPVSKDVWGRFEGKLENLETKHEKKQIMEEYGRIRAWLGNKDNSKLRNNIEEKLNTVIK